MKLFQNTTKKTASTDGLDIQSAPARIDKDVADNKAKIKVDLCVVTGNNLFVAGWHTHPVELSLLLDGDTLSARKIETDRPDVNTHFQLPATVRCGFVLIVDISKLSNSLSSLVLTWVGTNQIKYFSQPLTTQKSTAISTAEKQLLGPALFLLTEHLELNSPKWKQLIAQLPVASGPCRNARGYLEGAAACDQTKDAVVVGWIVHSSEIQVWLEDQNGFAYSLDKAYRRFRQDVHEAISNDFGHASHNSGFVLHINGLNSGSVLRLKVFTENGIYTLSETTCSTLALDPVAAARWLFAVGTPLPELHQRIPLVDEPVLAPLIEHRKALWDELPVQEHTLGEIPDNPEVSVIVPLYGRVDFVEHQLIEFAKDEWLQTHAEIIYVVDDPKILEEFNKLAETLYRLYKVPFRWLWGGVNRGFSGANNLGAQSSQSPYLVFLNSDAFPQQPGWLQDLTKELEVNTNLGAIGARLVYGDGGLQHAGMQFQRRNELGIWVNHHPLMGLEPSLDPHQTLTVIPAVTGACLAMRRSDFERVGGWDTGYLIGDFEDSDLCLNLRAEGMQIGYLPSVQLTHLERQSFKLLGQDDFRQRVVIYNAVRHQTRWGTLIEKPFDQSISPV